MRTQHFTPPPLGQTFVIAITILILQMGAWTTTQEARAYRRDASSTPDNTAVTTFHNDNARTGQNLNETLLTTSNVNVDHFGKRVAYPVDGQVYTQPLFVPNVGINGKSYNVVYIATENDSVYAFDADQVSVIQPLWKTSFINPPIVTTIPSGDLYARYPNRDITPQVGITGTPVIDMTTHILYVVAATKENGQYFQHLHALDIATGQDKIGSPIEIKASVAGKGYDNINGIVSFNEKTENQRAALLLANGIVYITWASFGDSDPYHGWIIGYTYHGTILQQVGSDVYNDTANGQEGGIWMSAVGLSADSTGNIYAITGNGTFDLNTEGVDAGNSFLRFNTQSGLRLTDYFTPFNHTCLDGRDADLGSGGPLLLPDQVNTLHPQLMLGIGKEGRVYLVDRDNMGQYTADPTLKCNTPEEKRIDVDKIVQELPTGIINEVFGIPAYWEGTTTSGQFIYTGGNGDKLKAFQLNQGKLVPVPTSVSSEHFAFSGATPSISSNGNKDGTGIVWVNSPSTCGDTGCTPNGPGALRAYDATNLNNELYNSEQNASRDRVDSYVKFTLPTIANGQVFVGTQDSLEIYGLLGKRIPVVTAIDDQANGNTLAQFNYTGNWGHCTDCNFDNEDMYAASNSWDKTTNDTMTCTFVGSQISFYGVKRPIHGIGAISLDGGNETLLDFYAPQNLGDQMMWRSPGLAPGQHTLKLRVTGTKNVNSTDDYIAVDRVDVTR